MRANRKPDGLDITITLTFPNDDDREMSAAILHVLGHLKRMASKKSGCRWVKLRFSGGLTEPIAEKLQRAINDFHASKRPKLRLVWNQKDSA